MEENISGDVIELNGYGDMQPESQPAQHEQDSYYVSRREWDQRNKTRKLTVVITYAIAVLFLLAGLFAPLFTFIKGGKIGDMMMFKYLMVFLNGLIPSVKVPESGWFAATPTWIFPGKFDFISLIDLLLILTTVIAVVMIVPVVLCKKEGNAYKNCALIVEIIAISLMGLHLVFKSMYSLTASFVDYNVLIALAGTMIMAVVQSIATKGSLGVFRLFSLLLAFLALLTWIGYVTFVPAFGTSMGKFANSLKATNGLYGQSVKTSEMSADMTYPGLVGIDMLVQTKNYKLFAGGTLLGVNNIFVIILSLLIIINFICDTAELNLGAKFKKDYNASSNVFCNAILLMRYVLSFLIACTVLIFCFASDALKPGVYLYILLVILFIGLALAIVRTVIDSSRVRRGVVAPASMRVALYDPNFNKEKKPEPAPLPEPEPEPEPVTIIQQQPQQPATPQIQILDYTSPYYDQQPQQPYILPVATPPQPEYEEEEPEPAHEPLPVTLPEPEPEPEPAPKPREYPDGYDSTPFMDYTEDDKKKPEPEPEPEPEPAAEEPVYVYAGETDAFIETLTDSEKVEFYETFIRKSKGEVKGVPDYKIDEKNEDFFSSVFVHINRFRSLISDTLLGKMYKQLGKVNLDEE